jgi:hypothetical protein
MLYIVIIIIIILILYYYKYFNKINKFNGDSATHKTINNFPIDVVYTWAGEENNKKNIRQCNHNELKYSIQLLKKNLNWVNNIYVFMNSPKKRPEWMDNDIIIYDHNDIIKTNEKITNSNKIETYLPYIPGLSEHFIYMNDDFFIIRKLSYTDFFTSDGKAITYIPTNQKSFHINTKNKKINIKFPSFGGWFKHIPIPMIKSQIILYHKTYPDYINFVREINIRETLGCNICNKYNLHCPCQQQHAPIAIFMYNNNKAVKLESYNNLYFDISDFYYNPNKIKKIFDKNIKYICINNSNKKINSDDSINEIINNKFNYFMIKFING